MSKVRACSHSQGGSAMAGLRNRRAPRAVWGLMCAVTHGVPTAGVPLGISVVSLISLIDR